MKGLEEKWSAGFSCARAKPNDHKEEQTHKREPSRTAQCASTRWTNKETCYFLLQRSKTSLSLCASGLKRLRAKWIILQLLLRATDIILRLLIIFINPPISSIQHWRKLLLRFNYFGHPHNPITFLSSNRLCALVSPLFPLPLLRRNTHEGEHSDACLHSRAHRHTHSSLCWGYQYDTGHWDCVFSVQSEWGDKGSAHYRKARQHSS